MTARGDTPAASNSRAWRKIRLRLGGLSIPKTTAIASDRHPRPPPSTSRRRTGAETADSATAVTTTALTHIHHNITRKWRPLKVAHRRASWMNRGMLFAPCSGESHDPMRTKENRMRLPTCNRVP